MTDILNKVRLESESSSSIDSENDIEDIDIEKLNDDKIPVKRQITSTFLKFDSECFEMSNTETKGIDHLALCDELVGQIESGDFSKDEMIANVLKIKSKLKLMSDIGRTFNKKQLLISSFCNTSENILIDYLDVDHVATKGDFERKLLECPSALESLFSDEVYGNPIGVPINFVIDASFVKIMDYMEKLRQTTELPIKDRLVFGSYRLDKVCKENSVTRSDDDDEEIKYLMVMTDVETEVSIKSYVYSNYSNNKMRVQNVEYSGEYIFDAIADIVLRKAVRIGSDNMNRHIAKLSGSMQRHQRVFIWEKILNIVEHDIELLNNGYKCIDIGDNKMLKLSTETVEPCSITCVPAPYTKIHMVCEHTLSLMAVYGIVYEGKSNSTESILCPMCRENLIPKLIPSLNDEDLKKVTVKSYTASDLKQLSFDVSSFVFEDERKELNIFTKPKSQEDYIDNIFRKKGDDNKNNYSDGESNYSDEDENEENNEEADDTYRRELLERFRSGTSAQSAILANHLESIIESMNRNLSETEDID